MTCDEYRALLLSGVENADGERHAATCAACRGVSAGLRVGRGLLDDPAMWEAPSPELEEQVVSLVAGSRRQLDSAKHSRRTRRGGWLAAAMLAIVLGAGSVIVLRTPAPDWEVPIEGTDLAPLAAGTVKGWNTSAGTKVVLEIAGLPPAPPGRVYELWFSRDRIHLSAGSFTSVDGAELSIGVRRADYPRLWVTLEPVDGDAAPSGQTVLDTPPPD